MRYQNWDVLLFAEGSKIPIQEFKTQCHVTKDHDSPFLHDPSFNGIPYITDGRPLTQLPVLTTFVGSLMVKAPFRVSIHSWERPKPSRIMESLMSPEDLTRFEARVYLDGVFVAGEVFNQRTSWPHVIETSAQMDTEGRQDSLRFPAFHQEILQQAHWDAGELLGRIRVVIAEGFSHNFDSSEHHRIPFFERFKDVVAFSFQHAPPEILEFSGIAWPNPGMWKQARNVIPPPTGGRPVNRAEEDAHAHSPRRSIKHSDETYMRRGLLEIRGGRTPMYGMSPSHTKWLQPRPNSHDPITTGFTIHDDPFSDMQKGTVIAKRLGTRSNIDDISMLDYVSSCTEDSSRALSNMTGISYEQKAACASFGIMTDAAMDQLVKALSPAKKEQLVKALSPSKPVESGTQAPANAPSSVPHLGHKPSAASRARFASYWGLQSRKASSEVNLPHSDIDTSNELSGLFSKRLSASPADSLQSRKEAIKKDKEKEDKREKGDSNLSPNRGALFDVTLDFQNTTDPRLDSSGSICNQSGDPKKRLLEETRSPSVKKKVLRQPSSETHSPRNISGSETSLSVRMPLSEIKNPV